MYRLLLQCLFTALNSSWVAVSANTLRDRERHALLVVRPEVLVELAALLRALMLDEPGAADEDDQTSRGTESG